MRGWEEENIIHCDGKGTLYSEFILESMDRNRKRHSSYLPADKARLALPACIIMRNFFLWLLFLIFPDAERTFLQSISTVSMWDKIWPNFMEGKQNHAHSPPNSMHGLSQCIQNFWTSNLYAYTFSSCDKEQILFWKNLHILYCSYLCIACVQWISHCMQYGQRQGHQANPVLTICPNSTWYVKIWTGQYLQGSAWSQ